MTALAISCSFGWISLSSLTWPVRGIITSGFGSKPRSLTSAAASKIARTCILTISGIITLSRMPRRPIIGLLSCIASTLASKSSLSASGWPLSRFSITCSNSSCSSGINSCSGGSMRRMITGKPVIASNRPSKSSRWKGSSSSSAFVRSSELSAKIIL